MKTLIIFLLISIPFVLSANGDLARRIEYSLKSSEVDPSLPANNSIFEFEFIGPESATFVVRYSIDGTNKTFKAQDGQRLIIPASAGKHLFQFYTSGYQEVSTDSLAIKSRFRDVYTVYLRETVIYKEVLKPVIYLYPEEEIQATVTMNIHGHNAFLYPEYVDNWSFTAKPNGDLIFGENNYNYLFWEADAHNPHPLNRNESGFIVARNEVVAFLEDKLTRANLSTKEKADFITFWGPRLVKNDLNFVHFIFNEECADYAGLQIEPVPNNLYRIYIIWSPVEETFAVPAQEILPAKRTGFHVIEWGGQCQILPSTKAHFQP